MQPRQFKILYLDDSKFNTGSFDRAIPGYKFTDTTDGAELKVVAKSFNRVPDVFRLAEFQDPTHVAPFDLILMDEQLDPIDAPANGPAVMKTLAEGTTAYSALAHLGEVPPGYRYHDNHRVMYSGEAAYKKGDSKEIEAHLSKIKVGIGTTTVHLAKPETYTTINVYSSGIMTRGYAKPIVNAEELLKVLTHVLSGTTIKVETRSPEEIAAIQAAQVKARAAERRKKNGRAGIKTSRGGGRGRGRGTPLKTQSACDLQSAAASGATLTTEESPSSQSASGGDSPLTGDFKLDFSLLKFDQLEKPPLVRAISAPFPSNTGLHRTRSAPPDSLRGGLFTQPSPPLPFVIPSPILPSASPSTLETPKITDSSPSSARSTEKTTPVTGTPSPLSAMDEDRKSPDFTLYPRLDFSKLESSTSVTPKVTPTGTPTGTPPAFLSDNPFSKFSYPRKGSTPKNIDPKLERVLEEDEGAVAKEKEQSETSTSNKKMRFNKATGDYTG